MSLWLPHLRAWALSCAAIAAVVVAASLLGGCGGGEDEATAVEPDVAAAKLGPSVEAQSAEFLDRSGTELDGILRRFLGPIFTTRLDPGSAICRPASQTPSIDEPKRFPFACVVEASANGQGLEVEIVLGFVGTKLEGRCWRAANERVLVTTTRPTLLGSEALRPVNQIAGCA
ncbi:MAG TPA: hypothetical protein VHR18_05025 [Solirubrobacterales bacterium]|jgi:hypothetical protein|nr:hypothetical protein [Solirubrobacterales bacterium]